MLHVTYATSQNEGLTNLVISMAIISWLSK